MSGTLITCILVVIVIIFIALLIYRLIKKKKTQYGKEKGGMAQVYHHCGTTVLLEDEPTLLLPSEWPVYDTPIDVVNDETMGKYMENPLRAFAVGDKIKKVPLTKLFYSSIGRLVSNAECGPDISYYRDKQEPLNLHVIFDKLGILQQCKEVYDKLRETGKFKRVCAVYQGDTDKYVYASIDGAPSAPNNAISHVGPIPGPIEYITSPMEGKIPPFATIGRNATVRRADARNWFQSGTAIRYPLLNVTYAVKGTDVVRSSDDRVMLASMFKTQLPTTEGENDAMNVPGYKIGDARHFPVYSTNAYKYTIGQDKNTGKAIFASSADGMADIIPASMTEYIARYAYEIAKEKPEIQIDPYKCAAYILLCAYFINYCGATTHAALYNADIGSKAGYRTYGGQGDGYTIDDETKQYINIISNALGIKELVAVIDLQLRTLDNGLTLENLTARDNELSKTNPIEHKRVMCMASAIINHVIINCLQIQNKQGLINENQALIQQDLMRVNEQISSQGAPILLILNGLLPNLPPAIQAQIQQRLEQGQPVSQTLLDLLPNLPPEIQGQIQQRMSQTLLDLLPNLPPEIQAQIQQRISQILNDLYNSAPPTVQAQMQQGLAQKQTSMQILIVILPNLPPEIQAQIQQRTSQILIDLHRSSLPPEIQVQIQQRTSQILIDLLPNLLSIILPAVQTHTSQRISQILNDLYISAPPEIQGPMQQGLAQIPPNSPPVLQGQAKLHILNDVHKIEPPEIQVQIQQRILRILIDLLPILPPEIQGQIQQGLAQLSHNDSLSHIQLLILHTDYLLIQQKQLQLQLQKLPSLHIPQGLYDIYDGAFPTISLVENIVDAARSPGNIPPHLDHLVPQM